MRHVDPHVHVNHRLTVAGLGDRFELRLRNGNWEYCTGLDIDAATILRDQLTAWIDSMDAALPGASSRTTGDPTVYQRDVTWGGGK